MKFKRTILSISISSAIATLTACGGGGGGGGSSATLSPFVRSQVPFYTPTAVATVDPLVVTSTSTVARSQVYTGNVSGSTSQDVIVASHMDNSSGGTWSDSKLHMFSWENGILVDKTSQWFPNNINQTVGSTEIKLADFGNRGRDDLFVMPGTDSGYVNYAYFFNNTGSSFTRNTIALPNNVWVHDTVVYDVNRDGFKDFIVASYGPNSTFIINNQNGNFTPYVENSSSIQIWNASSIAAADFLGNNTTTLVITDPAGPGTNAEFKSVSIANGYATVTSIGQLPTPRFMLPKWASYNFGNGQGASHEIRAVAKDFDRDGQTDVIIVSRPWLTGGIWPNFSEIQFLKNNAGTFTDVTDNILVGYNTATSASYNLKFIDFNGDGLEDILVSGVNYTAGGSHQFLINTVEGKYVAAYQNILTEFTQQAFTIASRTTSATNNGTVNIVQGPNNKMYLLTYLTVQTGGDRQLSFYLSELGTNTSTTAQATATAVSQVWPYMSAIQVNEALARTSQTYFGARVLDPERVFAPIDGLGISINGRTGNRIMLSGGLVLPNAANELKKTLSNVSAVDGLGRDFSVNLSGTVGTINERIQPLHMVTGHNANSSWSSKFTLSPEYTEQGLSYSGSGNNYSISADTSSIDPTGIIYRFSHARTPGSPWLGFGGMWGELRSSSTFELSASKTIDNWWAQAGVLRTDTEMSAGLISRVTPITSVYAVAGYQEQGWNFYAGVKPYIVSGSVEFNLPTSVDSQGTMSYTRMTHALHNPLTGFVGVNYGSEYRNHRWSFGAVVDSTSKSALVAKYQWRF